tara:strand:- start:373 stop:984 length:612 start_codon:yes stop_codon:yes gene_type:complete
MNFKDFVSISEDVKALANINKDLSFDEFIDEVIVNSNYEKIRNQDTYVSLYTMNLGGIGSSTPMSEFTRKMAGFFNPLLLPDGSGKRPRPEETPEFAKKHNKAEYDELDAAQRQAIRRKLQARRDKDDAAEKQAEAEADELGQRMRNTEFQIARQKVYKQTEQYVKDLFNTPITRSDVDGLKAKYPEQYADLEQAYNNMVQSA